MENGDIGEFEEDLKPSVIRSILQYSEIQHSVLSDLVVGQGHT